MSTAAVRVHPGGHAQPPRPRPRARRRRRRRRPRRASPTSRERRIDLRLRQRTALREQRLARRSTRRSSSRPRTATPSGDGGGVLTGAARPGRRRRSTSGSAPPTEGTHQTAAARARLQQPVRPRPASAVAAARGRGSTAGRSGSSPHAATTRATRRGWSTLGARAQAHPVRRVGSHGRRRDFDVTLRCRRRGRDRRRGGPPRPAAPLPHRCERAQRAPPAGSGPFPRRGCTGVQPLDAGGPAWHTAAARGRAS